MHHLQPQDHPRGGPGATHQDTAQQWEDERGCDLCMEAGPTETLQYGRSEWVIVLPIFPLSEYLYSVRYR